MAGLLIGDVARRIGVSAPTIRYYESLGLLTTPGRSTAGYRRYTEAAVEELRFIKKAQGLGFSLDEVGEILTLTRAGRTPCAEVLSLGHQHLAASRGTDPAIAAVSRAPGDRTGQVDAAEGACQLRRLVPTYHRRRRRGHDAGYTAAAATRDAVYDSPERKGKPMIRSVLSSSCGGAVAGFLTRPCCVIPAALSVAGISSASVVGAMLAYQPVFLAVSAVTVLVSLWMTFRREGGWFNRSLSVVAAVVGFVAAIRAVGVL